MQVPVFQPVGDACIVRGDGLCGFHCARAIGALLDDPRALDCGYFPFNYSYTEEIAATRKRILDAFDHWWAAKREFYVSDAEMEEAEVAAHVDGTSHEFGLDLTEVAQAS